MASRPIADGNISFGLVSIPVKLFSATRSRTVSFNLLHAKDQSRIQQKIFCPADNAIIDRGELVRGYEFEKGRYVSFTDEELTNLESHNDHSIEITEFLPLDKVDPLYFEESYYLASTPNASKAYRLLADAMAQSGRVALGRFTMRGKEHIVLIRPFSKGLILHTIYYADEVRPADEVDRAVNEDAKESELALAKQLIDALTQKSFDPSKYHDTYRERVIEAAEKKIAGQQITEASPEPRRGQVIDLMAALKASLDKRADKAPAAAEQSEDKAAAAGAGSEPKSRGRRGSARSGSDRRRAAGKK
jgi:DNA end-binding protein Ku